MISRQTKPRRCVVHPAPDIADHPATSQWEWRAFAPKISLPDVPDLAIESLTAAARETWLLVPSSSLCVVVRGEELEIRRLDRIDRRNLALWRVVHRYRFPLGAAAMAAVCRGLETPDITVETPVDRDQFLAAMALASPEVIVAPVQAQRIVFRVAECSGEHVTIQVGDQRWETLALFSQCPGCVHAALQRLKLSQFMDMSWPRALKLMLGVVNAPAVR